MAVPSMELTGSSMDITSGITSGGGGGGGSVMSGAAAGFAVAGPWGAVAGGLLGIIGANQEQKNKDREAEDQARALGIKNAGIDFSAERTSELLITRMAGIQEARTLNEVGIDKARARAESDAKVNAAVAGVSGASVDATINDTSRTAAEAKASLKNKVRLEALQVSTDYVDNFLNADMAKGKTVIRQASQSERNTNLALGFASSAMSML